MLFFELTPGIIAALYVLFSEKCRAKVPNFSERVRSAFVTGVIVSVIATVLLYSAAGA